MHKVPWAAPVIHYALRGDRYEANRIAESFVVRAVPSTLRAQDIASCNKELRNKLMGCAFIALDGGDAHSALGPTDRPDDGDAVPMCAEDAWIYVNLCTHLTCYGDGGALAHAERVHCTTVCMPRHIAAASAERAIGGLRAHWANAVEHACRSARVVVKHKDSFQYLHADDLIVLKTI